MNPTLNIIDGLVGQSGREWHGEGRTADTLIVGDHVIATDACGAYLMGFDPGGDWPSPPFTRDRNALYIANDAGYGTACLSEIDFQTERQRPVAHFATDASDTPEIVRSWRRTTCEQALYYRDNRTRFISQYAGQYILLQDNKVKWHDNQSELTHSRRVLSGGRKDQAMFLKYVDPDEAEGEHFEVYEKELKMLQAIDR
jgi:hypothetical protein